jgi:AsmA protein
VEQTTGRKLRIEHLQVTVFPIAGARISNAQLSNAPGFGEQPFARIGEAQLSVRLLPLILHHRVRIGEIILKDASLNLVRHADGSSNWDDLEEKSKTARRSKPAAPQPPSAPEPHAEPPGGSVDLQIAGIDIDNATVSVDDQQEKHKFVLSGFTLKSGALGGDSAPDVKLAFDLVSDRPQIRADASLSAQLAPRAQASGFDVEHLEIAVKAEGADCPPGWRDFSLNADVHFNAANHDFTVSPLVVKSGADTLAGNFAAGDKAGPVNFALKADRLDWDSFVPPRPQQQAAAAGAAAEPAAAVRVELPFADLQHLGASGTLDIGQLTVRRLHMQNVHLQLDAVANAEKRLSTSMALYGGTLNADTRIGPGKQPQVRQTAKVTGVGLGPLLTDYRGRESVSGTLDASFDTTGSGRSLLDIRHSLNGDASFKLRDGAIKGIDLVALIRRARPLPQGQEIGRVEGAQTAFTSFSATGKIDNGVLHSEDLLGQSPVLRIQGDGDIDLGEATIDYIVLPALVDPATGKEGKPLAELAGVRVPIRIEGPLSGPHYHPDLAEAVKRKLIDNLGDKKGGLLDRIESLFRKDK